MDEELTEAIIKSLNNNSPALTPLSLSVLNLETKLEQHGLNRMKLNLTRKINHIVSEMEEKILDLLEA